MAEQCTHDCSSCSQSCSSREQAGPASFLEKPHELSSVKHVVAVASGKGGVGKSFVTSMLAVGLARRGYKTAVLDADITGPSIPKLFGIHEQAQSDGLGIYPALTGQVLVCVARATMHRAPGCYTMIEVPVIDLLPGDREDIIAHLV